MASRRIAIPADDEWFDLEYTIPMVGNTSAPRSRTRKPHRVKLVHLGDARNLAEAKEKANLMGYRLVEGQARDSFKAKFPKPDGKGPIVFNDSESQGLPGSALASYLYDFRGEWHSHFFWSGLDFHVPWRWLVERK